MRELVLSMPQIFGFILVSSIDDKYFVTDKEECKIVHEFVENMCIGDGLCKWLIQLKTGLIDEFITN